MEVQRPLYSFFGLDSVTLRVLAPKAHPLYARSGPIHLYVYEVAERDEDMHLHRKAGKAPRKKDAADTSAAAPHMMTERASERASERANDQMSKMNERINQSRGEAKVVVVVRAAAKQESRKRTNIHTHTHAHTHTYTEACLLFSLARLM